jgi:FkbM family methyltransferase
MNKHVIHELRERVVSTKFEVVFDVDANVGQTCKKIHEGLPSAQVWAFEPVRLTYTSLVSSVANFPNVRCFNLALGASDEVKDIMASGTSTSNRIIEKPGSKYAEKIHVRFGDSFCSEHGIGPIDYLKNRYRGL